MLTLWAAFVSAGVCDQRSIIAMVISTSWGAPDWCRCHADTLQWELQWGRKTWWSQRDWLTVPLPLGWSLCSVDHSNPSGGPLAFCRPATTPERRTSQSPGEKKHNPRWGVFLLEQIFFRRYSYLSHMKQNKNKLRVLAGSTFVIIVVAAKNKIENWWARQRFWLWSLRYLISHG